VRLTILASGSSGNTLLIEAQGTAIYLDAGLRRRGLRERRLPLSLPAPDAVFLTHEHADHIVGADDLAAQGLWLYATAGTVRGARLQTHARARVREVRAGVPVRHGALEVLPVALPHDAAEPVAYLISDGRLRLGVLTDCGHPCAEVTRAFAGCDALVLEANHDPSLLRAGPYPPRLKDRIASDHGHLSNAQAAALLADLISGAPAVPSLVVGAHLSRTNNRGALARAALAEALGRGGRTRLQVVEQGEVLGPLMVEPALPGAGRGRGGQLSLPF
jgi:phosphoribosyl 1,2-cyclic phosphodiesterase